MLIRVIAVVLAAAALSLLVLFDTGADRQPATPPLRASTWSGAQTDNSKERSTVETQHSAGASEARQPNWCF